MLGQRLTQSFVNGAAIGGILLVLFELNITALKTIWRLARPSNENTNPRDEELIEI